MSHEDVIRSLARYDALATDDPPLAVVAIDDWYRDACVSDDRAEYGDAPHPVAIAEAIDSLGKPWAESVYSNEWERIVAERTPEPR